MMYPAVLEAYRMRAEESLGLLFSSSQGPKSLKDAMEYSLFAGGKRVRPVLLLATNAIFDGSLDPLPAACAMEYIHTYSLIHDDLPAMDDDDYRRGKPTNHKKFGEAMAILSGDGLLTEAFGLIARSYAGVDAAKAVRVLEEFALGAGSAGMVGGQVRDTLHTGSDQDMAAVEQTHRMKTGALIITAVRCGAILGDADRRQLAALTEYARKIGLAFQVSDDLLDVVSDRAVLGKSTGKDQVQGKTTYPSLMGIPGSEDYLRQLTSSAKEDLQIFGGRAVPLVEMATFISELPALLKVKNKGK
jgi:geranylgeranyl diphosphate synthase type II